MTDRRILEKLAEAEKEASDPNAKWLSHDEVFSKIREKYGYDTNVALYASDLKSEK